MCRAQLDKICRFVHSESHFDIPSFTKTFNPPKFEELRAKRRRARPVERTSAPSDRRTGPRDVRSRHRGISFLPPRNDGASFKTQTQIPAISRRAAAIVNEKRQKLHNARPCMIFSGTPLKLRLNGIKSCRARVFFVPNALDRAENTCSFCIQMW